MAAHDQERYLKLSAFAPAAGSASKAFAVDPDNKASGQSVFQEYFGSPRRTRQLAQRSRIIETHREPCGLLRSRRMRPLP